MDRFADRLSEYLDEELTPHEREAVDAHLETCAECRRTIDELREVTGCAGSLVARPPQADLWPAIAARLDRPDRVVTMDAVRKRTTDDRRVRFSFTLAQLAAAAAALVIVSAGATWVIGSRTAPAGSVAIPATASVAPSTSAPIVPVANFADAQYDAAVADLQRALQEGRGRLDPKTIAIVEKNLAIIDQAIDQARTALGEDPADTYLNSYLADARRRKLDLLRDAAATLANLPM